MTKLNVKAGDKVIKVSGMGKSVEIVAKVTPKGFIKLTNGLVFNPNGILRTTDMCSIRIEEYKEA